MPGVAVNVAVIHEGRILLTRRVGVYPRMVGLPDVRAVVYAGKPAGGELKTQSGETIEVAYFPFVELPEDLSLGHKRGILDAIHGVAGISVRQVLHTGQLKTSRQELYARRDRSALARRAFYRQQSLQAEAREIVEVENL